MREFQDVLCHLVGNKVKHVWLSILLTQVIINHSNYPVTVPMFKRPIIQQEIQKMIDRDVIEPRASTWNSPYALSQRNKQVSGDSVILAPKLTLTYCSCLTSQSSDRYNSNI